MSSPPADLNRPSPDALLRQARREGRGRLKVFLGAAPGVGKTYEMLSDSAALRKSGIDVVVGVVETHGRTDTAAQAEGFEVIALRPIDYQGRAMSEMDLDAILARKPALVLVDELAHTNVAGSRHPKRYQDVEEILAAGIDVFTTLNIQHIESLNDVIASFTKVRVRETVPDSVIEDAEIEIVDIPPDELIERLKQGKVYVPHEATRALGHFFSKSNLSALRELALRRAAQTVDAQMLDDIRAQGLVGTWAGSERVLVAVSELPGADGLVRASKRLADALRAPWVALHVETPRDARFSEEEKQRLAANLQLASGLGAEVVSVPSESVLDGIKRYALEARTTQIVVGKSQRSRWFELRHGSVVDQLVRDTPDIAVHVLPGDAGGDAKRSASPAKPGRWGTPWGYLWSGLLVALVTLLGASIYSLSHLPNIALLFLLPVMFAATRHGLRTGVVTGGASALAYNFFFIPPLYTFTIQDPQNVITFVVLILVAIVSSQFAARVQAQAELAQRSAAQNSALAGFARNLTGITARDELGQVLSNEAARLLDVDAVFILCPDGGGPDIAARSSPGPGLDPIDEAAARWAFDRNQVAGRGSGTLTASDWMFHPLSAGGRVRAVLGLARSSGGQIIRSDQHPLLISLTDQASLALERVELEEEMVSVSKLQERDRLRAALLSSVGHDLRTPLTTILASLQELKAGGNHQPELASIESEALRLNRFVANLLDMVRIESGGINLSIDTIDLTEAIASAAHDLRAALANHPLKLGVPPDFPLVRADAQLLHHCFINLIDNAAKYSPEGTPITIAGERGPFGIRVMVMDEGGGLSPGSEDRVFDTFTRMAGSDRTGGTGLGLAIVRGFAEAMGLTATAANRNDRAGAVFTLTFPESSIVKEREES